jgi:acetoin utilization deacetylase AcuC-like enzyme
MNRTPTRGTRRAPRSSRPSQAREGRDCILQHSAGHRHRAAGAGFFNNAPSALPMPSRNDERVALIDFDAHHGNGTEDICRRRARVDGVDVRTRLYLIMASRLGPPSNVPLERYSRGDALRDAVAKHWLPALDAFRPQMVYFSAGFDAHREDDMSRLMWVEGDYTWLTRQIMSIAERHAQGRVVSLLEGGYVLSALARSAAAHVQVLIGAD